MDQIDCKTDDGGAFGRLGLVQTVVKFTRLEEAISTLRNLERCQQSGTELKPVKLLDVLC